MKILIVEDEPIVAARLQRLVKKILSDGPLQLLWKESLDDALDYLGEHEIDVLLLDLNLHGANGFDVLETVTAQSFHTIIVSAYSERAITAFEYGVLDFVPKPFKEERLAQALHRVVVPAAERAAGLPQDVQSHQLKQLAVKKHQRFELIPLERISHIKADGHYSILCHGSTKEDLHSKRIEQLMQLLPEHFVRVHRSYVVNWHYVQQLQVASGGYYHLRLSNQHLVPVSRSHIQTIKQRFQ